MRESAPPSSSADCPPSGRARRLRRPAPQSVRCSALALRAVGWPCRRSRLAVMYMYSTNTLASGGQQGRRAAATLRPEGGGPRSDPVCTIGRGPRHRTYSICAMAVATRDSAVGVAQDTNLLRWRAEKKSWAVLMDLALLRDETFPLSDQHPALRRVLAIVRDSRGSSRSSQIL